MMTMLHSGISFTPTQRGEFQAHLRRRKPSGRHGAADADRAEAGSRCQLQRDQVEAGHNRSRHLAVEEALQEEGVLGLATFHLG